MSILKREINETELNVNADSFLICGGEQMHLDLLRLGVDWRLRLLP